MKMKSYMYDYDFNIYYIHPKCDHSESWLTLNNGLYLIRIEYNNIKEGS